MNRQEIGNRLKNAREDCAYSRNRVAAEVGIGTTTLQQWETGTREASIETIGKLAELYCVSSQYLIFGEVSPSPSHVSTPQPPDSADSDTTSDDYVYIPAYDIEVSAGHGSVCFTDAEPHKHLAFRQRWITARGLQADALAALFTRGDSMTPTIPEGAAVIIDQTRNQALDGKVYVIRIDDRHYVKRVQWLIGGGLRLISDNKLYDPLDITKDDMAANNIQICGQVIHASYDLPD